jgi:hypothetical protein
VLAPDPVHHLLVHPGRLGGGRQQLARVGLAVLVREPEIGQRSQRIGEHAITPSGN